MGISRTVSTASSTTQPWSTINNLSTQITIPLVFCRHKASRVTEAVNIFIFVSFMIYYLLLQVSVIMRLDLQTQKTKSFELDNHTIFRVPSHDERKLKAESKKDKSRKQ